MSSYAQDNRQLPQLAMMRPNLADLPEVCLPEGYTLRCFSAGDESAWDRIISESFEWEGEGHFRRVMYADFPFRPERIFFVCKNDTPVATASAWYRPEYGRDVGYVHMVGVLRSETGNRLGYWATLATLHRMREEGRTAAALRTDDFRVPAIKTYLRLGFEPLLLDESHRERWARVFREIERPELIERFAKTLSGPLFDTQPPRPNADSPERYEIRQRWHQNRQHRGGPVGGGDLDFMGDESLYKSAGLGSIEIQPNTATAGDQLREPLSLIYTAGSAGLQEGTTVQFVIRGQSPLGFSLQGTNPNEPGYFTIEGPEACEFEPHRLGFRLSKGFLRDGDRVRLVVRETETLLWNKVAGRRELKAVIHPPNDPIQRRLPAPAVIEILPLGIHGIEATLPCTRAPGQPLRLHVTARDEFDNRVPLEGMVSLEAGGRSLETPMVRGLAELMLTTPDDSPLKVSARLGETSCQSNVCITAQELNLYIGDPHCHDFLSEAEGYPDEVYRWAIEDRNLDFISVVPQSHGWHDNETWTITKYMNERFLDEGRFVTFLGFEWQHTGYGDKVVHFLNGDQAYLPVDDARYASAPRLYEALRGSDALVVSHHPAYPPGSWCASTDFDVVETDVERLVELWSMHGSSEGYDPDDRPLSHVYPKSLVMSALRRGVRLGFTAGSDSHSGRPGGSAKEPMPYWGGLTGVWAESLTRRGIFEAMYARRTYALTGARIILEMTVNGAPMGSEIPAVENAWIDISVWGQSRIRSVEVMKNGGVLHKVRPNADECHLQIEDQTGGSAFYHCRVTQEDGHLAVCSPVWVG